MDCNWSLHASPLPLTLLRIVGVSRRGAYASTRQKPSTTKMRGPSALYRFVVHDLNRETTVAVGIHLPTVSLSVCGKAEIAPRAEETRAPHKDLPHAKHRPMCRPSVAGTRSTCITTDPSLTLFVNRQKKKNSASVWATRRNTKVAGCVRATGPIARSLAITLHVVDRNLCRESAPEIQDLRPSVHHIFCCAQLCSR